MRILKIFFPIIIICIFANCNSKENSINCPNPYDMGTFELLESSINMFPFSGLHQKVIFSDSLDNEIEGRIIGPSIGFGRATTPDKPCLDNPEIEISIFATTESYSTKIFIDSFDLKFSIGARVSVYFPEYEDNLVADIANIVCSGEGISNPDTIPQIPPQIAILLNERNRVEDFFQLSNPIGNLEIHGKEFQNVYESLIGSLFIKFYFNFEFGIIGFEDQQTNITYKFLRFE